MFYRVLRAYVATFDVKMLKINSAKDILKIVIKKLLIFQTKNTKIFLLQNYYVIRNKTE